MGSVGAILSKVCGGRGGSNLRPMLPETNARATFAGFPRSSHSDKCAGARECSILRDGGIRNPSVYRPAWAVRGPTRHQREVKLPLGAAEYTQGERRGLTCRIILVGMPTWSHGRKFAARRYGPFGGFDGLS
jgi:hypothetical protein